MRNIPNLKKVIEIYENLLLRVKTDAERKDILRKAMVLSSELEVLEGEE